MASLGSLRPFRRRPAAVGLALLLLGGCGDGEAPATGEPPFEAMYAGHCANCHGDGGWGGPALPLANPAYQAWVGDDDLRRVIAGGRPGTAMPAFARRAGGPLAEDEIEGLIRSMRSWWRRPLDGADPMPPYATGPRTGMLLANDAISGAAVYVSRCMACHEPQGAFRPQAGGLRDPHYLAGVSDQALRSAVVAGRPDLGMPDWRGDERHPRLEPRHVSEVVAYLASFRRATPRRARDDEEREPPGPRSSSPEGRSGTPSLYGPQ